MSFSALSMLTKLVLSDAVGPAGRLVALSNDQRLETQLVVGFGLRLFERIPIGVPLAPLIIEHAFAPVLREHPALRDAIAADRDIGAERRGEMHLTGEIVTAERAACGSDGVFGRLDLRLGLAERYGKGQIIGDRQDQL